MFLLLQVSCRACNPLIVNVVRTRVVESCTAQSTSKVLGTTAGSYISFKFLNNCNQDNRKCTSISTRPGFSVSSSHCRPSASCSSTKAYVPIEYTGTSFFQSCEQLTKCDASVLVRGPCPSAKRLGSMGAPAHWTNANPLTQVSPAKHVCTIYLPGTYLERS